MMLKLRLFESCTYQSTFCLPLQSQQEEELEEEEMEEEEEELEAKERVDG